MYGAFDGRIEVLEVNEEKNEIKVSLTKRIGDSGIDFPNGRKIGN